MIWVGLGLSAIGAQAGGGGAIAPPPPIPDPVPVPDPDPIPDPAPDPDPTPDPVPDPDPAPDPGPALAALPVAPATRWHPGFSQVTVQDGRVVTATDLQGLAGVISVGAGLGPQALSDGQGRAFWRFAGGQALEVAAGLVCDTRAISVFMVARVPRHPASYNRYFSLGAQGQGSQVNTLGGALESRVISRSASFAQSFGKVASSAPSGAQWLVTGAQKQVIGAVCGAAGTRLSLNERSAAVAAAYKVTGVSGAEIGRYAWSPGAAGSWGVFDLYDMVVYDRTLTEAEAQAVSEAFMQAHDIVPITSQLVLEGDSITQGTGDVTDALSCAAVLTEPGTNHVPPGWRVCNLGTSGNKVADLVAKRDAVNGWAAQVLPGQNVMAFEVGRNDVAAGVSPAALYSGVVAYLNTASTGVLQRGWSVRAMANIASSPALMPQIEAQRSALRSAQFLSDTGAQAGGAFAGRVSTVSTDLIEHAGAQRFATSDAAADTAYYAGDSTHPSVLGAQVRVTGGDTPAYGVAAGLSNPS